MIERGHALAVTHQCELLALSRSSAYHLPAPVSQRDLEAMRLLDEAHLQYPFYGSRRLSDWLRERGVKANRKRVRRLMRRMGLEALYPRPRTSRPGQGHKVYPYLLRELTVERPNQVWAADICYLPMARGFLSLVAVMDWYSRFRLGRPLRQQSGIPTTLLRFGAVLDSAGGALGKMLIPFRLGLGGRLGSGKQFFPWIAMPEIPRIIEFLTQRTSSASGPVNVVSPQIVTNGEFTQALARHLRRPAWFSVPEFVIRSAFGEMGQEMLLSGCPVLPQALVAKGYVFRYPTLDACFKAILPR